MPAYGPSTVALLTRVKTDPALSFTLPGPWKVGEYCLNLPNMAVASCPSSSVSVQSVSRRILFWPSARLHTNVEAARVHSTRAYGHAEHALVTIQGAKFGHRHVQSRLAHCVGRSLVDVGLEGHLRVRHACGDGDDFLGASIKD